MPDHMDRVQQHAQRPRMVGLAFCADEACGEPVSPERQAMGAQLCLECQSTAEARAAHFGKRGPR